MKLPLVTPIYKDTVNTWTYSSGLVNQTGMIYIDNLEYQISSGMFQSLYLLRMHNPEGYADNVTINPYGPFYYYYHKDHLGFNREVWKAAYSINGTVTPASIVQQTSYYPSGLPWSDGSGVSAQPFKYNGKEFIEMHWWDTYDYGAKGYYPAMGRFMTVDPLAEMDYSVSPYTYCKGNPINMIDPNGMTAESSTHVNSLPLCLTSTFVDTNNKIIEHRDDGDPTVYEVENEKEWRDKGSSKIGLERVGDEDPWVNYNNEKGNEYKYFLRHKDWIDDLAMHMRNNGAEDNEKAFLKAFGPIIMGLVMYNPLIGVTNDVITLKTGKDIYGNKSNKYLAGASLITLNTSEYLKLTGQGAGIAMKLLDKLSKLFTTYSAGSTTKTEFNKQK